jgi:streptogramin lyase
MAASTPSVSPALTRRGAITLAAAATTVALAAPASAHDRRDDDDHHGHGRLPDTVALPNGLRPEGITSGPGTTFYVGSVSDGRIVTGDLRRGATRVLLAAATGRSLRGLFRDRRTGLVWAVGSLGADAHVWAVDGRTGAVVADVLVPGGAFLNDLVVTERAVWFTDSRVDRLGRIALTHRGRPTGDAPTFVTLGGDWPGFDGTNIAANGIRQLPDGSLVLNHSSAGGLWQVDPRTGVAREIAVGGGPRPVSGDGLVLVGNTLYDVRGNGANAVSVFRLRRRHDRWVATAQGTLTDPTLDVPSTATFAAGSLWAVNARFGNPTPDTASYWITRLETH